MVGSYERRIHYRYSAPPCSGMAQIFGENESTNTDSGRQTADNRRTGFPARQEQTAPEQGANKRTRRGDSCIRGQAFVDGSPLQLQSRQGMTFSREACHTRLVRPARRIASSPPSQAVHRHRGDAVSVVKSAPVQLLLFRKSTRLERRSRVHHGSPRRAKAEPGMTKPVLRETDVLHARFRAEKTAGGPENQQRRL